MKMGEASEATRSLLQSVANDMERGDATDGTAIDLGDAYMVLHLIPKSEVFDGAINEVRDAK